MSVRVEHLAALTPAATRHHQPQESRLQFSTCGWRSELSGVINPLQNEVAARDWRVSLVCLQCLYAGAVCAAFSLEYLHVFTRPNKQLVH